VSPRLTILLIAVMCACSLSFGLGPVRVFAARCSHARDGADTSRLLYAALQSQVAIIYLGTMLVVMALQLQPLL
jgi:hypothetical protein